MFYVVLLLSLGVIQCIVLVGYMYWVASIPHVPGENDYEPSAAEMQEFILWKSFYANPNDPRAWPPKTWGGGKTVNFRTKKRAMIFGGMLASCFLLMLSGGLLAMLVV